MTTGLLVNIPDLQSCCLQLISVTLYHTLTTDDILAVFTKGLQKPKREHQLLLKDPSVPRHAIWSFLQGPTGVVASSAVLNHSSVSTWASS